MLKFLLLFSILLSSTVAPAANRCSHLFSRTETTVGELTEKIRNWRKSRIEWTDVKWINVHNVFYKVQGILGRGSSTVYLAKAPEGHFVSIKVIEGEKSGWLNSIYYEIAATDFYLKMNEVVPRIYDFEIRYSEQLGGKVGVLVKEYREGVTREELEYLMHERPRRWAKEARPLLGDFPIQRQRIQQLHKKFAKWLEENRIKLKPFKELKSLIKDGDLSEERDNFLFDAVLERWILFDP